MANELTLLQKDITDNIARKLDELKKDGGLAIPANYNPANALKSAFFEMTNSASGNLLEKCSRESIANSLLNMAIQGLSPRKSSATSSLMVRTCPCSVLTSERRKSLRA